MKTGEQWVAEAGLIVNGTSRAEHLKLVKAIQEDAWRDGVRCGVDLQARTEIRSYYTAFQQFYDKRFGRVEGRANTQQKTACHCGKRLNENGLCWCCDPISTCWPQ